MIVYDILKEAIDKHRCVIITVDGKSRAVAPLALGFKAGRKKVLTFQYRGDSKSGLAAGGAWRCFFLDDISWAKISDDPWQSGQHPVVKLETSLDSVLCGQGAQIRSYRHMARH
jgi:predicted DNA-binding transcriptional regulator YafY